MADPATSLRSRVIGLAALCLAAAVGLLIIVSLPDSENASASVFRLEPGVPIAPSKDLPPNALALQEAARAEVGVTVLYDASYVKLPYPNGDVPMDRGVCTDVVIRALRKVGIDLQKRVHEDIVKNSSAYAQLWGHRAPDSNIDHRRIPNLMTYYKRECWDLPITKIVADYRGGDIVVWRLPSGALHTGMVYARDSGGPLVVHNMGGGAQCEDVLFAWKLIGHYRVPDDQMK